MSEPIPYRPIKNLRHLLKDGIHKLSKTEFRFMKLLNELKNPLTEEKIIYFYQENVQMHDGRYELKHGDWVVRDYTHSEIRIKAMQWFDRNLGCMIRKQLLSNVGNIKLNELVLVK